VNNVLFGIDYVFVWNPPWKCLVFICVVQVEGPAMSRFLVQEFPIEFLFVLVCVCVCVSVCERMEQ
jgi:hypothetical protein